jgi:serine protease AprX
MSSPSLLRHRLALQIACALGIVGLAPSGLAATIDPGLREQAAAAGTVDVLIVMQAKAPRPSRAAGVDYLEHRRALVAGLRATAEQSQAPLRAWLDAQHVDYRAYWAVNTIAARLTPAQIDAVGAQEGVARVASNAPVALSRPDAELDVPTLPMVPMAIEWGVNKIRAPEVWAAGIRGQNVVISGQDTGYQWDHPAIKAKYRGWNGTAASHDYNWHDAIHATGSSCGANALAPCDDNSHGTHTMGTMVGDDGAANQIGVAPDARWVGCRNMNAGNGTPATYIECTQWFIAPTDMTDGNPDSDRAPDIVNNSWGCVVEEGCTTGLEIREAIENIVEAGILFVAAAGNDGSACSTIGDPPAIYDIVFTVGGTASTNTMYAGSGRGPVAGLASVKPDVIAPGQSVRSSVRGGGYSSFTGTSMASPHVAGAAALLMSVNASLKGNPQRVAEILRSTAVPLTSTTQVCGGIPSTVFPNPVQGHGQIDVYAAFLVAEKIFANGAD